MFIDQQLIGNRYQLHDMIGRGGMGAVYRATDRLTGQIIALKRVTVPGEQLRFASIGASNDYRLALAQEFRTLASLRHPNIISVLDYGFHEKQPYFTMDLLENPQTVTQYGRGLSSARKADLLMQILHALTYLHRRGIIHRDLKPDNVQVVGGQVRVLDFGLAVASEYLKADKPDEADERVVGTLAYMAPEVLQGGQVSEAADLYAVGVIAYELFAGEHPFAIDDVTRLLQDIITTVPDVAALDLSEDLQTTVGRLLAKAPEDRFPSASAVIPALAAAVGGQGAQDSVTLRESFLQAAKFVGRDQEMRQLTDALAQAKAGQGSGWLVSGESGVGKSRLLNELAVQALVDGMVVLRGQAITEESSPYRLWGEALRRLALSTDLSDLEASVIKVVVPDIARVLGREVADAPEIDPGAAQKRLLTVVEDILRRQQQPTLIILEDLQWAVMNETESLALLLRLAPVLPELPILLIASYRDDERPDLHLDFPQMQRLLLKRLSREQVEALSLSILGEDVGHKDALVDLLQRETEGNIFFIVEVIRALAEEAGTLEDIGHRTLPAQVFSGGMKTVIERRLMRLPIYARPLVELAAVAGRQLDLTLLKALDPLHDLDRWLGACADAAVIEVEGNAWRFTHDKLREAVRAGLTADRRRALHEQVALGLEQVYPGSQALLATLAQHWGEAGNTKKEAHYAALAGEQVLSAGAYQSAIPLLRRALDLAAQVGTSPDRLAYLTFLLGEANWGAGDIVGCTTHLEQALRIAGLPTWPTDKTPVEIVQGFATHIMANPDPDRDGDAPAVLVWAVRANERLGQVYYVQNEALPVIFYDYGGLELAVRIGKPAKPELVRLSGSASVAMSNVPLHDLARAYIGWVDAHVESLTDLSAQCWALMTTGVTFGGWGLWAEALPRYERTIAIAEQVGDSQRWFEAGSFITSTLHHTGRYADAARFNERFYALFRSQNFLPAAIWCGAGRVLNAVCRGEHALALEYAAEAEAALELLADRLNNMRIFGQVARIYLRLGELDRAHAYAERVMPLLAGSTPSAWQAIDGCASLSEFYAAVYERERSASARQTAETAWGYLEAFTKIFDIGKPQCALYRGWLDVLNGQSEVGYGRLREGIEAARTLGMPYEEASGWYHLGRLLPVDTAEREVALVSALLLFERLGAAWDAEQTRAAFAQ